MKTKSLWFSSFIPCIFAALALLVAGCAGTRHVASTEQLLMESGFKKVVANSDAQSKHLQTLPMDKLTMTKQNGKTVYVFPDPAHNQIYVGDSVAYQTYQETLTDQKLAEQTHVMKALGEDGGHAEADWAAWNSNSGWTSGSY